MEPGQDTGKSDATQGGSPGGGPLRPRRRTPEPAPRTGPRWSVWALIAVAVVLGLALFFLFEHSMLPLYGGGH